MNQNELDEAIAKIRRDQPSDETVKASAGRVFRNLFDSTFISAEPAGKIRGCEDIRGLIPAYLNHTLSSPRTLLLEDHVLNCVECRRALNEARHGAAAPIPINRARARRPIPMLAWAAAAALLVGVGLGVTGHFPGQNSLSASVASVQGQLYRVTDLGASLVEAGYIIQNTDELRTPKGSHAFLRLAGGAMVEIAERTDVRVSRSLWRGTSLNLERGQMIVDTHKQTAKALYVTSGDMTVPVTSGIVAVNHGTKESRVAVAQGAVNLRVGPVIRLVKAGNSGQLYGGGELRLASFKTTNSEFAWSDNAAAYSELLNQLAGLQKDIQALPSADLRYSSTLPQYLPADTFLYAAIPNLGGTITEAKKLFDARLAESEALRQWWQQKEIAKNGKFDKMVNQISALSSYLGNEIVISVSGDVQGSNAGPVFIAQITQPGLDQYLATNFPDLATSKDFHIQTSNNMFVASPSAAQIQRVENMIQNAAAAGPNFTSAPFYARVAQVYKDGAATFLAANLEQITAKSVNTSKNPIPGGFDNVQYLVLNRKGDGEMSASLSFSSARQGIASWLAAPGPTGSLNFVSRDANFAASMVMKSPRLMMQELFGMVSDPNFTTQLNEFESQAGVHLLDDVAAPLGNDMTIAMEGPITPVLAVEVNDPNHLQQTIATLVAKFNQQLAAKAGSQLTLGSTDVNGRTYYSITSSKASALPAIYTFVDGYLVASTSQGTINTAIANRQAGQTLVASDAFRAQLPADNYTNFSAMVYTNLGPLGALAQQMAPAAKKNAVAGLIANSGPSLICVYGDTNSISAATKGSFLGFNLGTLVDIQQGKPLNSVIAAALPKTEGGSAVN